MMSTDPHAQKRIENVTSVHMTVMMTFSYPSVFFPRTPFVVRLSVQKEAKALCDSCNGLGIPNAFAGRAIINSRSDACCRQTRIHLSGTSRLFLSPCRLVKLNSQITSSDVGQAQYRPASNRNRGEMPRPKGNQHDRRCTTHRKWTTSLPFSKGTVTRGPTVLFKSLSRSHTYTRDRAKCAQQLLAWMEQQD